MKHAKSKSRLICEMMTDFFQIDLKKTSVKMHAKMHVRLEMIRFGSISNRFLPHRIQIGILRFLADSVRIESILNRLRFDSKSIKKCTLKALDLIFEMRS